MKVALLAPPSPFLIDQKAFAPLGLTCLAAYVRAHAPVEVRIVDLAGREEALDDALVDVDADVFGVSATTPQYPQALRVLETLKRRKPAPVAIVGGVHPTCLPQECFGDGWDHVVTREGERALVEILSALARGKQPRRVMEGEFIEDLDQLPFPAYDLLPLHEYGYNINGRRALTVMTSRGCPYQCAFCSKDVWEGCRVRFHSPDYVERLLRHIIETTDCRDFLFVDDSLTLNRARILDICRRIEPFGLRFRCYAHVKTCTREVLEALKRAGCVEIGVGIESGAQEILDAIGKGTTVEGNARFIELCREIGIESNAFIMIGLPGETRDTVAATRAWMERARPDKFGYNIFMPYVGTPIHRRPELYDIRILPMRYEDTWVKGRQGEYHAFVETSALSRDEIITLFEENFRYFTELTGWRPGYNERVANTTPEAGDVLS